MQKRIEQSDNMSEGSGLGFHGLLRTIGKKEEITDLIRPSAYKDKNFKVGLVLKMEGATLKLTRVDRKNKRCWAEHIELVNQRIVLQHYNHLIDKTKEPLFCIDCRVNINEASTEDGEVKAAERQERTLSDGTEIEEL